MTVQGVQRTAGSWNELLRLDLEAVASAREELEALRQQRKQALDAFLATLKPLDEQIAASQEIVEAVEEEARLDALRAFEATQNKRPGPGITIRETVEISYTEEEAVAYAIGHDVPSVLKLDKAAFKSFARAVDLPFVTTTKVPVATLPTDVRSVLDSQGTANVRVRLGGGK